MFEPLLRAIDWKSLGPAFSVLLIVLFVASILILRVVRWAFDEIRQGSASAATEIRSQREAIESAHRMAIEACTNHINHNTETLVAVGEGLKAMGRTLGDIHDHVHQPRRQRRSFPAPPRSDPQGQDA